MNYIRQKVEVSTELAENQIVVESSRQEKRHTNNKVLPFALLILSGIWIGLSVMNNGQFLTEAILTSVVVGALLFMMTLYNPKNLRSKVKF